MAQQVLDASRNHGASSSLQRSRSTNTGVVCELSERFAGDVVITARAEQNDTSAWTSRTANEGLLTSAPLDGQRRGLGLTDLAQLVLSTNIEVGDHLLLRAAPSFGSWVGIFATSVDRL